MRLELWEVVVVVTMGDDMTEKRAKSDILHAREMNKQPEGLLSGNSDSDNQMCRVDRYVKRLILNRELLSSPQPFLTAEDE